jgi:hypothetical protein
MLAPVVCRFVNCASTERVERLLQSTALLPMLVGMLRSIMRSNVQTAIDCIKRIIHCEGALDAVVADVEAVAASHFNVNFGDLLIEIEQIKKKKSALQS